MIATKVASVAMAGLAFSLLSGCQATPPRAFEDCRAASYAALEAVGIDPDRVRQFTSSPQRVNSGSARGDDRVVGYWNWLRLDGCDGAIVFRFSRTCRIRHVYERGDCVYGPHGTDAGGTD